MTSNETTCTLIVIMSSAPNSLPPQAKFILDPNTLETVNPRGLEPVYSNNAAVMTMPYDFRLVFTEIIADGPANQPRIEMRASVVMSPAMLKGLHHAIGTTLASYEQQQGEIKWPPQQPKTN